MPAPSLLSFTAPRRVSAARWIALLLLLSVAAAGVSAVAAIDPTATDSGETVGNHVGSTWNLLASADDAAPLPEPRHPHGNLDSSVQFRREAPGGEPRRRNRGAAEGAAPAEAERGNESTAREVAAIEATAAAYREAVSKGDVDAVAKFWTAEADYVDQAGHAIPVKEKLAQAREKQRQGQSVSGHMVADPGHSIRIITPGVAIEDGRFQNTTEAEPIVGHYTAVWLKREGHWLLDGVRESAVVDTTPADHLKGLAWLVGEWQGKGNGVTADASYVWGPDKNYLLRKVVLRGAKGEVDSTIQWIGWDPIQKQIRSFVFDSAGGFEDGVWTNEGDAWVDTSHGVLPDGRRAYFTTIHSRVDANHIICEIVDDEIDDEPVEDVRIDFQRKTKTAE